MIGFERESAAVSEDFFVGAIQFSKAEAERKLDVGVIVIEPDRLAVCVDRLFVLSERIARGADIYKRRRPFGAKFCRLTRGF